MAIPENPSPDDGGRPGPIKKDRVPQPDKQNKGLLIVMGVALFLTAASIYFG